MLENSPAVSLLPRYSAPLIIIPPAISVPSPMTTPFFTSDRFPIQSSASAAHFPSFSIHTGFLYFSSNKRPNENNGNQQDINFNFTNFNVSYILIKSVLSRGINNIYAVTGGRGYNIIQTYIEKDFELNLIPKLIGNDEDVVKKVRENRLRGNRLNITRTNRNNTNINFESDYFNIYKELELIVGENILNILGFPFENDNNESNKTRIINKDSICILKSISIDALSELINNINNLQFEHENFVLNQYKKISSVNDVDRIYELFSEVILNNNYDNYSFEVFGNDITEYC